MIERIESDLHRDAVTDRSDIRADDLKVNWTCTLLEFFYGSTKKIAFHRTVRLDDTENGSYLMKTEEVLKEIEIKPGMKPGTELRFVGEGNHTIY